MVIRIFSGPFLSSHMNNSSNHIAALIVGFMLIVLVIVVTFTKPYLVKKDSANLTKEDIVQKSNQKVASFSADDLSSEIIAGNNIILIDLRNAESFSQEHIIGAKNVLVEELENILANRDWQKKYVLIDEDGTEARSYLQVRPEQPKGKENNNIFYLEGGFSSWKAKYFPTISAGDPYSMTDQAKVKYLNSEEAAKLAQEETLIFIDLRKSEAYAEGHIKDAAHIYLENLEEKNNEIPRDKKIILYDKDGLWAFQGAVRLFDMGFLNVYALSDGLDGWKSKGFEIAK